MRWLAATYPSELRAALGTDLSRYRDNPVAYIEERLGHTIWAKQREICEAIVKHKRVLVRASHSVGKTFISGALLLYWYECFDPSIVISTAPSEPQVVDLLWREVRAQGEHLGCIPFKPAAPRIEGGGFHYAVGYTAADANAFQGKHEERLLVIFDEAIGVRQEFWEASRGMTTGEDNRFLAIYNPTDPSSPPYQAEQSGNYHVIQISALHHPNVLADLEGRPHPIRNPIGLAWVEDELRAGCQRIDADEHKATDLEWPPASGIWYRPGGNFEARVMGRWPSTATDAIWSDAMLDVAFRTDRAPLPEPATEPCEIGCDVAGKGDNWTTMHVRRGDVSLHHERHQGWESPQIAGRLKELAGYWGRHCGVDGRAVAVKIDDTGVGAGVTALRTESDGSEWRFVGINAASRPFAGGKYPNRRSELWFAVADRARDDRIDLSRLDDEDRAELRRQFMAPKWALDSRGFRVVEPKDKTKLRLKVSPDDADAANLAYAPFAHGVHIAVASTEAPPPQFTAQQEKQRLANTLLTLAGHR